MKKKNGYPNFSRMNIICYNDEDMYYYHGVITEMGCAPQVITYQSLEDCDAHTCLSPYNTVTFQSSSQLEYDENIKLDDTTMKRIAKFNKTQECKRLDKQIEEKKQKLKELDDLLQDREKRWDKVKDYIKNIYEISLTDEDEYDEDYYD